MHKEQAPIMDSLSRPIGTLRLSLTDRCNLRCTYCMPDENYTWLARKDCLSLEEEIRVMRLFAELGTRRFRITGGEPLIRKGCVDFVRQAAQLLGNYPQTDLAMTTNGLLLEDYAVQLKQAGLERLTISLDTLREDRFESLTQRKGLSKVLDGIKAVTEAGFKHTKINTVIMRGFNDDEVIDLVQYAASAKVELRFIEYMDVGGATQWNMNTVMSNDAILEKLKEHYGEIETLSRSKRATARRYRLPNGVEFGIIASTTRPFCEGCDRSRVTADGTWYHCLYAAHGFNLRDWLREEENDEQLKQRLITHWQARAIQGAVEREGLGERGPLVSLPSLRQDPRLEMHTRGG